MLKAWWAKQCELMRRSPRKTMLAAVLLAVALLFVGVESLFEPETMALWRSVEMGDQMRFDDLTLPLERMDNVFQSPSIGEIVQRPGVIRGLFDHRSFAMVLTLNTHEVPPAQLAPIRSLTGRFMKSKGCAYVESRTASLAGEPMICDHFSCSDGQGMAQCTGPRHSASFRGTPDQMPRFYSQMAAARKAQ